MNLAITAVALVFTLAPVAFLSQYETAKIDCAFTEFHPDFTPQQRQHCRKARK